MGIIHFSYTYISLIVNRMSLSNGSIMLSVICVLTRKFKEMSFSLYYLLCTFQIDQDVPVI